MTSPTGPHAVYLERALTSKINDPTYRFSLPELDSGTWGDCLALSEREVFFIKRQTLRDLRSFAVDRVRRKCPDIQIDTLEVCCFLSTYLQAGLTIRCM